MSAASSPLIVILGPTASGKTGFSIELATEIGNAEIINADSRQLYRFLNIGTAKIRTEEMKGIPHHLIDVIDPTEEVTAAWYKTEAERVISDIHARHKIPMLVGGSMLYISAVIDGLEFGVSTDPVLRARLESEYERDGGVALYDKLMEIDPDTTFARENKPYVIRAMEIYELTKQKPSAARKSSVCPYDLFIIGIEREREELNQRINARTKELFAHGWIEEVQSLLDRGYTADDPAMKSHGYKEIMAYLRTGTPEREMLEEQISAKTRQYAKRQMTWWRGDPRIQWMTPHD